MPKSPFENWITIQEHRRSHTIFLVEWLAIFGMAWLFWSAMFILAPGSIPAGLAATALSGLYATCLIYGRLMNVTGCRKCGNGLPFTRKEVGRRHLHDEERCVELEYGGEDYDQHFINVYCKVSRSDMVTYQCRACEQMWEERIELPGSGYKLVRHVDLNK